MPRLLLTRKIGQQVIVRIPPSTEEREILITYVEKRSGERSTLSFEAPESITINRQEIDAEIQRIGHRPQRQRPWTNKQH